MVAMNGDGYRLLGFVVWQGGRWYLRRRVPSMRRLALRGAGALVALTVAAVLAKRLAS
jgi:hypothetical protein